MNSKSLILLGSIMLTIGILWLGNISGRIQKDVEYQNTQGELTIYTPVDIYYVNTAKLEITTESGHLEEFTSFPAMQDWLEANTAHDVNYKLHRE